MSDSEGGEIEFSVDSDDSEIIGSEVSGDEEIDDDAEAAINPLMSIAWWRAQKQLACVFVQTTITKLSSWSLGLLCVIIHAVFLIYMLIASWYLGHVHLYIHLFVLMCVHTYSQIARCVLYWCNGTMDNNAWQNIEWDYWPLNFGLLVVMLLPQVWWIHMVCIIGALYAKHCQHQEHMRDLSFFEGQLHLHCVLLSICVNQILPMNICIPYKKGKGASLCGRHPVWWCSQEENKRINVDKLITNELAHHLLALNGFGIPLFVKCIFGVMLFALIIGLCIRMCSEPKFCGTVVMHLFLNFMLWGMFLHLNHIDIDTTLRKELPQLSGWWISCATPVILCFVHWVITHPKVKEKQALQSPMRFFFRVRKNSLVVQVAVRSNDLQNITINGTTGSRNVWERLPVMNRRFEVSFGRHSMHIARMVENGELHQQSTHRQYRTTHTPSFSLWDRKSSAVDSLDRAVVGDPERLSAESIFGDGKAMEGTIVLFFEVPYTSFKPSYGNANDTNKEAFRTDLPGYLHIMTNHINCTGQQAFQSGSQYIVDQARCRTFSTELQQFALKTQFAK
jgi:hypothetical protein